MCDVEMQDQMDEEETCNLADALNAIGEVIDDDILDRGPPDMVLIQAVFPDGTVWSVGTGPEFTPERQMTVVATLGFQLSEKLRGEQSPLILPQ